jgi:hypothetical protein
MTLRLINMNRRLAAILAAESETPEIMSLSRPAVVLFKIGLFVNSLGEVISNAFRFGRSYRLSLVRLQLFVIRFNWEIVRLQGSVFGHLGVSSCV